MAMGKRRRPLLVFYLSWMKKIVLSDKLLLFYICGDCLKILYCPYNFCMCPILALYSFHNFPIFIPIFLQEGT